jgi:polar amino acid transport system substrate-binding protein
MASGLSNHEVRLTRTRSKNDETQYFFEPFPVDASLKSIRNFALQGRFQSAWTGALSVVVGLLLMLAFSGNALAIPAMPQTEVATQNVSPDRLRLQPEEMARPAMPPDMQRILDRGKLTVAVLGQDNPPFFMKLNNRELEGLDIQIAQALANQLSVTLDINRSAETFDDVVDAVYQLKADLAISKISRTLKRSQRVRFSQPYLRMRQGLLVNRLQLAQQAQGRTMEETIRNLKGKVGVLRNSSYVGFLKQKFPQATIVEFPTWSAIVDAVVQGDILAAYRDELEVKKVVRTKPDAALQLQTIALTDTQDSLAVVLPWNSTHLLAFVDQYLETMAAQYTVDLLLDEYADYWSTQRSGQP